MVAGERQPLRAGLSAQPGGRLPAPEPLAVVQAFINTHYDLEVSHGAEVLDGPASLCRWLRAHGLVDRAAAANDHDLRRALAARDGLRALARRNGLTGPHAGAGTATHGRRHAAALDAELESLNRAATGAPLEVRFAPDGPHFTSAPAGVSGAIGVLLAITACAMSNGTWERLKICPGRDCDWAFYDHSRNQAGRWCSMSICGGREKARAHYRRRREAGE
jgi:predicted RNA-binding Zn ribbon-like protein